MCLPDFSHIVMLNNLLLQREASISLTGWAGANHKACRVGAAMLYWNKHICAYYIFSYIVMLNNCYFSAELPYRWQAELVLTIRPAGMEQFVLLEQTHMCLLNFSHIVMLNNSYFSAELPYPWQAELVLTIGPTGLERFCFTDTIMQMQNKMNFLVLMHVSQWNESHFDTIVNHLSPCTGNLFTNRYGNIC